MIINHKNLRALARRKCKSLANVSVEEKEAVIWIVIVESKLKLLG